MSKFPFSDTFSTTYEPCHEKTCPRGFRPGKTLNRPAQLQSLARGLKTRGIILSRQRTTKALIRLCRCAGWSAPLLFAYGINRFSHDKAHIIVMSERLCLILFLLQKLLWHFDCFSLQVIVDDLDNSITYKFPCSRWLATDEDDGQIYRDLLVGKRAVDVNTGTAFCLFTYYNL